MPDIFLALAPFHVRWYLFAITERGQPMTGLQKIIEDAGISRRELARRVGISHTRINDACNGSETGGLSMPSLGAVTRELAAATGRSPGDILETIVMPVALPAPESAD